MSGVAVIDQVGSDVEAVRKVIYTKCTVTHKYERLGKNKHRFHLAFISKNTKNARPVLFCTKIFTKREVEHLETNPPKIKFDGLEDSGCLRFIIAGKTPHPMVLPKTIEQILSDFN